MEDVLKIKKGQWKSSKSCLFKLCSIWPMLLVCLNFPLSQFFIFMFLLLPLVGLFFVHFLCTRVAILCAFQ
jgi:hypothetical protein